MRLTELLMPEFDAEMTATRRVLERVPDADLAWKPHDKSFSMGQLAGHIANLPNWVGTTLDAAGFDLAELGPRGVPPASVAQVLQTFDANVKAARAKIDGQPDPAFFAPWTLKNGGEEVFTMPRAAVLRNFVMNHIIHHRGQLTVYLRLRNVPLPSIYGPTADEG